jgi:hypothetical protein
MGGMSEALLVVHRTDYIAQSKKQYRSVCVLVNHAMRYLSSHPKESTVECLHYQ